MTKKRSRETGSARGIYRWLWRAADTRATACHAVQFAGIHPGLPASGTRGFLPAGPARRARLGDALAARGRAVLLWLVERQIRPAAGRLDPGKLLVRPTHPAPGARGRSTRSQALADLRHLPQPWAARLVQIRRLRIPHRRRGDGASHTGTGSVPAAGHQLLHLPADHVPGGEFSHGAQRLRPAALRELRRVLSASDRRPDRASARDHAATAGARHCDAANGESGRRADDLPARPGEEAGAGRYVRLVRRCRVRRRRAGRAAQLRGGLVRGGLLRAADLLRLLRLFRHGDRARAHAERAIPAEFRQPVSGHQHPRILAALAHYAQRFPARSRLHPARRQSPRARRGAMST